MKTTSLIKDKGRYFLLGIVILLIIWLPTQLPVFWVRTLAMIFLYIYWASAWNIIGGMAGEINFLHPIFIGSGAYTSTLLYLNYGISPWISMFLGGIIACALGLAIGWICYRSGLPHLSFALICLGFAHLALLYALWADFLGGSRGLLIRPNPGFINMQFANLISYYYLGLVMASVMVFICWVIDRSKIGFYLKAIKQNEMAASAIGINTVLYRLLALVISAFFSALGGTFFAQIVLFIDPHSAISITTVITVILFCAIGGFGTVWGPVLGTILLMPIGEFLRLYTHTGIHLVIYGIVVIIVIMIAPRGLVPLLKKSIQRNSS